MGMFPRKNTIMQNWELKIFSCDWKAEKMNEKQTKMPESSNKRI